MDLLLESFDRVAFRVAAGPDAGSVIQELRRWPGPIRLVLRGEWHAGHRTFIRELVLELSRLTGLAFDLAGEIDDGDRQLVVALVSRSEWRHVIEGDRRKTGLTDQLLGARCVAGTREEAGVITAGMALVPNDLGDADVRHCLVEEITQVLGLYNDGATYRPSILTPEFSTRDRLAPGDKILLRTLYDPRLRPGMRREAALEAARGIIEELVRAVRERGERVLYQRP